ncbi:sigma-54 interaction domain-containing protein [Desulfitobacterium sp.]|uniref:sigma-54 interaction domain-containing protein n=1 Tax=Desulfitobacterium sp. TaxID=49981 RepID=UPI002CCB5754|nr:sigma 54-interacting transcriptional regulator [Desulfitobacterium sp.]HVJ50236.1 sigma 54-interacting transcriptional regulator [Desulfitobacterium sp.]
MVELIAVQGYAQQIAEAIATVVNIDIEIADQSLVRVAGTGKYRQGVGKSMDRQGYVYREVLCTGHQFVIENPGYHPLCAPCVDRENCPEKYEIVSPINIEGQTVGVIGLIGFTQEQADRIQKNQASYLNFIIKMAETIALKLKEQEFLNGLLSSNHYLNSLVDCLEEGLITVNPEGQIQHINQAAQLLFAGTKVEPQATLDSLFPAPIVQEIMAAGQKGEKLTDHEVRLENKQMRVHLILRAVPIALDDGVTTIAITLRPFEEISRIVNRLSTQEASYTVEDILGKSQAMTQLRERARTVAMSKSTVLIRGESGTGKEMLARAIHNLSPRRSEPFVAINCTAIPEALLESELFGYEEGAFTGARKEGKIGKFELANKGTLFLDEIGDMPLFLQAKILRVLQERQIERVGGIQTTPVDVRVIAATHRDLEQMMAQGEFREDLYYRINVIPMFIEALRNRKEDLEILTNHFIEVYNAQLGKAVKRVTKGFQRRLQDYAWPGNVRELQNVLEYAMNLADQAILDEQDLPARLRQAEQGQQEESFDLETIERETIRRCLQQFGTSVTGKEKAAAALGIGLATLYRKLARYGLGKENMSHNEK